MKKLSLFCVIILLLCLCGCSVMPAGFARLGEKTLDNLSFQYNEDTDEYCIFFALRSKVGRRISADIDVNVRIVNDDGVVVYHKTHAVAKDNFGFHSIQIGMEEYGAELRIAASDLTAGKTTDGKVYLTAYEGDQLCFDEANCMVWHCLPLQDIQVVAEGLPIELNVKAYDGTIASKIRIEEVTTVYDKNFPSRLQINLKGIKTFGGTNSTYDIISYKIYDHGGYMIESGHVFLDDLSAQDKFKNDSIVLYDAVPGETYTVIFSEYPQ